MNNLNINKTPDSTIHLNSEPTNKLKDRSESANSMLSPNSRMKISMTEDRDRTASQKFIKRRSGMQSFAFAPSSISRSATVRSSMKQIKDSDHINILNKSVMNKMYGENKKKK